MRILGIDPGSQKTGVGIIDIQGNRLIHVHHSVIRCGNGDFTERLNTLFSQLKKIIAEYQPDCVGMEDVFVLKKCCFSIKTRVRPEVR